MDPYLEPFDRSVVAIQVLPHLHILVPTYEPSFLWYFHVGHIPLACSITHACAYHLEVSF